MIKQMLKYKWYLAGILILMIADPSLNSVLNFWLQRMFNSAAPGADKLVELRLLTIGFLLWMLKRVVIYSSGLLKARFICNARQDVKHRMFVSLLGLNTSNIFGSTASGEYISLFTNDISLLESRFYNQVISLISGIFSIVIMGTSFLVLNARIATAILAFGFVSMLVPAFFSKKLNEKNLAFSGMISRFTQKMKEYTVAYPTIKNYSIEQVIVDKFDRVNQDSEDSKFEADYSLTLANSTGQLLSWFMQFIAVGLGIMYVIKGEILIGTVIAAQGFATDLGLPLQNIIMNINSIRSVKEIVKKLESVSEMAQEGGTAPLPEGGRLLPADTCEIEFRDLSLQMDNNRIIDRFSFTFESGRKYLVVGLNGAGKSSVFKALKKWFKNITGQILINGRDISELENEEISHVVSYLNENVSLFSGSVRDNILLFREKTEADFRNAVASAKINIDLDREIADEGRNVSSGEQRRIEIARSLVESARVLIFDEVVSTLDIETAYEIEKLALGFQDKTVIFISHNFSGKLIREYDEILVMDQGALVAHGPYQKLINECDYFRKICEIKFGTEILDTKRQP